MSKRSLEDAEDDKLRMTQSEIEILESSLPEVSSKLKPILERLCGIVKPSSKRHRETVKVSLKI
jgi:hypothetical protein